MFEAAVPARPLIPMAISLGFGVLYASVMTLFLVPCGYVILDDIAAFLGRKRTAKPTADPELADLSPQRGHTGHSPQAGSAVVARIGPQ